MLVRRVRDVCESPDLQIVGTSATMASRGNTVVKPRRPQGEWGMYGRLSPLPTTAKAPTAMAPK